MEEFSDNQEYYKCTNCKYNYDKDAINMWNQLNYQNKCDKCPYCNKINPFSVIYENSDEV